MKIIFTILLLIIITTGCTERVTKQFIVPKGSSPSQINIIENWTIETPKLIAFKNREIDLISDKPVPFWLTIRSKNNNKDHTSIQIDSIALEFVELDSIVWKTPTRKVEYKKNHFAFDFFKDQGVLIPESASEIKLFFDAIIIDTVNNSINSQRVTFVMKRQETSALTPFMIQ